MMGLMCKKCKMITGGLFLVAGLLYVLTDIGVVSFWNINWWSSLFVVFGITQFASSTCKDCQAMAK